MSDLGKRSAGQRHCGDCLAVKTTDGVALGVRDLDPSELGRLLRAPDDLLWASLDCPVKLSHQSVIVRAELPVSGQPCRVVFKRFRERSWWKAFWGRFRCSRARRNWRTARALLARRIPTARPLAYWEPRRAWWLRESYLANEWIDGAENLHLYGWRLAKRPAPQRLRRAAQCAESLGELVGRMHAARVSNRDLKGANLLIADEGRRIASYLIDMDGVRIGRPMTPARRAADLARLAAGLEAHPWITASVCRRFLRAYLEQFPPATIAWKPLWREVAARSQRIVRRKRRRGEPVL